jgi:hypothetical protein
MLDAVAVNGGGLKDNPPANSLSAIGSPTASFGVWQLPHAMMLLTR